MIQKQSLRSDSKVFQNSLQPEHIFRVTESPLFVTVIMKTNSTTLLHKLLPSNTDIAILKTHTAEILAWGGRGMNSTTIQCVHE